jgi:hypothetical protein
MKRYRKIVGITKRMFTMKPNHTRDITREDIPFSLRAASQIPGFPPSSVRTLPRITPPTRVTGVHGIKPAAPAGHVPPPIPAASKVTPSKFAAVPTVPPHKSNLPETVTLDQIRADALRRTTR